MPEIKKKDMENLFAEEEEVESEPAKVETKKEEPVKVETKKEEPKIEPAKVEKDESILKLEKELNDAKESIPRLQENFDLKDVSFDEKESNYSLLRKILEDIRLRALKELKGELSSENRVKITSIITESQTAVGKMDDMFKMLKKTKVVPEKPVKPAKPAKVVPEKPVKPAKPAKVVPEKPVKPAKPAKVVPEKPSKKEEEETKPEKKPAKKKAETESKPEKKPAKKKAETESKPEKKPAKKKAESETKPEKKPVKEEKEKRGRPVGQHNKQENIVDSRGYILDNNGKPKNLNMIKNATLKNIMNNINEGFSINRTSDGDPFRNHLAPQLNKIIDDSAMIMKKLAIHRGKKVINLSDLSMLNFIPIGQTCFPCDVCMKLEKVSPIVNGKNQFRKTKFAETREKENKSAPLSPTRKSEGFPVTTLKRILSKVSGLSVSEDVAEYLSHFLTYATEKWFELLIPTGKDKNFRLSYEKIKHIPITTIIIAND